MSDAPTFIGKVQPQDANTDSNLMLLFIRQALDRVNIATYCSVVAVYGGGLSTPPTVDVLPLVNTLDGLKNSQSLQVPVHGLQVYRYQGGTNAVICDPQVGDIGMVVVCDRDMSSVDANNNGVSAGVGSVQQSNPASGRRFNLSDGTFFPCVLGATPVQYIWFKPDGVYLEDKNGNSITVNGTGITMVGASRISLNGVFTVSSSGIVTAPDSATWTSGGVAGLTSLLVGRTTAPSGGWLNAIKTSDGSVKAALAIQDGNPVNGDTLIGFLDSGGTARGSIAWNGTSAVQYNTTSDERLKDWSIEQKNYRAAIESIWVGDFVWKEDGAVGFGIRAQQAHNHFPFATLPPKHADGTWQADYGKLAPLTLWGVKDLYRLIDGLREEISVLRKQVENRSGI